MNSDISNLSGLVYYQTRSAKTYTIPSFSPVGQGIKDPLGLAGSAIPALERRMALETALIA